MTDPRSPSVAELKSEILAAIKFYEQRGWDWLDVVAFLSAKAVGMLPQDIIFRCRRSRREVANG